MPRHAKHAGVSLAVIAPLLGLYLHLRQDAAREATEQARIAAEAQQVAVWQSDFMAVAQIAQRCGN